MSSEGAGAGTGEGDAPSGLVPKRRFPEFRNSSKWQLSSLQQLEACSWVNLGRGDVISSKDISAFPGDYPIYSSSVKNNGLFGRYGRFMFDEELISWSVDGGGDFFHRPQHKFSVTNVSGYMRLDTSRLSYRFVASQLQAQHASYVFDYQFKAHPSVIRSLYRLGIPELAEQQKIADCLSSLDALIAAEGERLAALRDHKKGLMQALFPAEGQTTPRLRFPEFVEAGEWEGTTVDAIAQIHKGKGISKADISADGRQACVRYGELYTTYDEVIDEVVSKTNVAQRELFMSKANDVVIPSSGETNRYRYRRLRAAR